MFSCSYSRNLEAKETFLEERDFLKGVLDPLCWGHLVNLLAIYSGSSMNQILIFVGEGSMTWGAGLVQISVIENRPSEAYAL